MLFKYDLQEDTCYEGGIFNIDIVLTNEYPYKPPKVFINNFSCIFIKMKFDTKIWHPNISS